MKKMFIVVAVVAMAFTAACSKKKTENTTVIKTEPAAGSDAGSAAGSDAAPAPAPAP